MIDTQTIETTVEAMRLRAGGSARTGVDGQGRPVYRFADGATLTVDHDVHTLYHGEGVRPGEELAADASGIDEGALMAEIKTRLGTATLEQARRKIVLLAAKQLGLI